MSAVFTAQAVMGHMAQLRQLMGVSDDLHKVRLSSSSCCSYSCLAAIQQAEKVSEAVKAAQVSSSEERPASNSYVVVCAAVGRHDHRFGSDAVTWCGCWLHSCCSYAALEAVELQCMHFQWQLQLVGVQGPACSRPHAVCYFLHC
jgi:hypothetical protein